MDYRTAKAFLIFYNLANLFNAQNRLKLGPQLPRSILSIVQHQFSALHQIHAENIELITMRKFDNTKKDWIKVENGKLLFLTSIQSFLVFSNYLIMIG